MDRRMLLPRDLALVRIDHTSWPGTEMAGRISTGSRQGQDRSAATRLAASSSADLSSSSMHRPSRVSVVSVRVGRPCGNELRGKALRSNDDGAYLGSLAN